MSYTAIDYLRGALARALVGAGGDGVADAIAELIDVKIMEALDSHYDASHRDIE